MIASHVAEWIDLWRLLILAVGTFNVGLAGYMMIEYLRGHVTTTVYHRRSHVLAIAASYILLTAALCTEVGLRVIRDLPPISYRLTFASLAFPLGTFALLHLLTPRGGESDG